MFNRINEKDKNSNTLSNLKNEEVITKDKNMVLKILDLQPYYSTKYKNASLSVKNNSLKKVIFPKIKTCNYKTSTNIPKLKKPFLEIKEQKPTFAQTLSANKLKSYTHSFKTTKNITHNSKYYKFSKGKEKKSFKEFLLAEVEDLNKKVDKAQHKLSEIRKINSGITHDFTFIDFIENVDNKFKTDIKAPQNSTAFNQKTPNFNHKLDDNNNSDLTIRISDIGTIEDPSISFEDTALLIVEPRGRHPTFFGSSVMDSFEEKSTNSSLNPFKQYS